MELGNLSQDLIGTDPKHAPIVDHSWLNPQGYDNYPSDNNPVRKQPELADLWNANRQNSGVSLVENQTVQPLGVRSAEQKAVEAKLKTEEIVREAKKAFMAGMGVKKVAGHLKSLFTEGELKSAHDELKSVSDERGLLGNVYVDASAFASYQEAEQFMKKHRNRLAQDLLFDCENMNPGVVATIASKFRKNVVSSVKYDDNTFRKYHDHLVMAGRIPEDFVIDSKETLRDAFLYEMPVQESSASEAKPEKKMSAEEIQENLSKFSEEKHSKENETEEVLQWTSVKPIVGFVQQHLSKGKTASDLKEMVKAKFAREDLNNALPYLAIVLSSQGLDKKHLAALVEQNRISEFAASQLETISKMFPVQKSEYEDPMPKRSSGVPGQLYYLSGKKTSSDGFSEAAITALRKGVEPRKVRARLVDKVGKEVANTIMSHAMVEVNSTGAGAQANKKQAEKKQALVEDPAPKKRLPDAETIPNQLREFHSFYEGSSQMEVEIDQQENREGYDISDAGSKDGLDDAISGSL